MNVDSLILGRIRCARCVKMIPISKIQRNNNNNELKKKKIIIY